MPLLDCPDTGGAMKVDTGGSKLFFDVEEKP